MKHLVLVLWLVLFSFVAFLFFVSRGSAQSQPVPTYKTIIGHDWKPMLNFRMDFCSGEIVDCERTEICLQKCTGEPIPTQLEWCAAHSELRAVRVE